MKDYLIRPLRAGCLLALTLLVAGCPKSTPQVAAPAPGEGDLAAAAQAIANDLARQVGTGSASRTLVIDPMLDRQTGQQTAASARVEEAIRPALAGAIRGVTVLPFNADGAAKSRLVATGSVTRSQGPDQYLVSVALTDRESGLVVAQAVARFRQPGLDSRATAFYRDSPSLVRDRSVDGYLKTSETTAGKPADALYVEQIPTSALLADALAAYNGGQFDRALAAYTAAGARQDGQRLSTFNGIYLTNIRLGRLADAEAAFYKIAVLGLATNNLAVKLLFRPGSTEFWADPSVSGLYPMWLRQIGRAVQSSGTCLNIVGHTSRSGSDSVNDRLALSRATAVRDLLSREVAGLERLARVTGVGSRQNLIGTGADDASDALDRRVAFEVVPCGSSGPP